MRTGGPKEVFLSVLLKKKSLRLMDNFSDAAFRYVF